MYERAKTNQPAYVSHCYVHIAKVQYGMRATIVETYVSSELVRRDKYNPVQLTESR